MKKKENKASKEIIQSYSNEINSLIEKHRVDINESLVSLRFLKELDFFMEEQNLAKKDLAEDLGVSRAFVSQLMSGTKKINVGFINRLEKKYNIEFKVNIQRNDCRYNVLTTISKPIVLVFGDTKINYYEHSKSSMDTPESAFGEEIKYTGIY